MQFIRVFVACLFLAFATSVFAVPLPPLPAGYERWVSQKNQCVLAAKDGAKVEYVLNLYHLHIPEKGIFKAVEIHRLNGEPYLVSSFTSRHVVSGYAPFEQRPFEGYLRGGTDFFVRAASEPKWRKLSFNDSFISGPRAVVLSLVDRDFLFARGTSTSEIKECLRVQSRNNRK